VTGDPAFRVLLLQVCEEEEYYMVVSLDDVIYGEDDEEAEPRAGRRGGLAGRVGLTSCPKRISQSFSYAIG
jgi:hypothetical protein